MPRPKVRNLEAIRAGTASHAQFYEAFYDLMTAVGNISDQGNMNPNGPVASPPQISAITVVPKGGGVHQVTIQDNTPVTRGISYFAEYSLDPHFSTFTPVSMGASRQMDVPAGTGNIFWRAYSSYQTSAPSLPIYHGASVNSTGTTASAAAGIAGTGSGTEPSSQPRGAAGFGVINNRLPKD
jgi:hypothetical protein